MHVVPFESEHLRRLALQPAQGYLADVMAEHDYGEQMREGGPCFTMLDGDGEVMICGGLLHLWEGRALVWSLVGKDAGRHMVRVFRAMRAFIEQQGDIRRLEATVDADFEQGHRLMEMLGWQREGLMRGYLPDGRDVVQYARVN